MILSTTGNPISILNSRATLSDAHTTLFLCLKHLLNKLTAYQSHMRELGIIKQSYNSTARCRPSEQYYITCLQLGRQFVKLDWVNIWRWINPITATTHMT